MSETPMIVIDGDNVVNHGLTNVYETRQKSQLRYLLLLIDYCQAQNYEVIVLISPKLKYHIDDPGALERLIIKGLIKETPAGVDSDLFILETTRVFQTYLISNDLFRQYRDSYPVVRKRRIPFLIINERIVLPITPDNLEVKQKSDVITQESALCQSS